MSHLYGLSPEILSNNYYVFRENDLHNAYFISDELGIQNMGLGCVLDKWVKAIQVELGFSSFFAIKTLKNHHDSVKIFNGVFQFALNQTFPEQKKNPTWVLIPHYIL